MKTRSLPGRSSVLLLILVSFTSPPVHSQEFRSEVTRVQQVSHLSEAACGCGREGCSAQSCRKVCVPTVESETVEKHRWKTEAKEICVPRVVLPWEKGGSGLTLFNCFRKRGKDGCCGDGCSDGSCCLKPRCGKVITVCDLKKEKYEKEKCAVKWEIRCLPPFQCFPPCHDGGCSDGVSCAESCGVPVYSGSVYSANSVAGSNAAAGSNETQLPGRIHLEPVPSVDQFQVHQVDRSRQRFVAKENGDSKR